MLHFLLEQNPTSLGSTKLQTGRTNSPCSYLTLAEVLWETQPRHSRTSHHLTSSWDLPFWSVVEPQSPRYNEAQWLLCLMSPMSIRGASHPRMMAWTASQNPKTQSPLIHSVSPLSHQYTCLPSAYILVEIVRPLLLSTCVLANGMSTWQKLQLSGRREPHFNISIKCQPENMQGVLCLSVCLSVFLSFSLCRCLSTSLPLLLLSSLLFCFVYWNRASLCNRPGCPRTPFLDQVSLELTENLLTPMSWD